MEIRTYCLRQQYVHFAGIRKMVRCDAFGQKMNGGVLWQKIKGKKKLR